MTRCFVHLSVICMSVLYVLWLNGTSYQKNCWNCLRKQTELPDRYPGTIFMTLTILIFVNGGSDCTPKYLHCELRPNSIVTIDILLAIRMTNALSNGIIVDIRSRKT